MRIKTIVSAAAGIFLILFIIMDVPFLVGHFVLAGLFALLAFMPEEEIGKHVRRVRWLYGLFAAFWLTLGLLNLLT